MSFPFSIYIQDPFNHGRNPALITDGYHLTTLVTMLNSMKDPEKWGVSNLVLRGDAEKESYTVIAGIWAMIYRMQHWNIDLDVQAALRKKGVKEEHIKSVANRGFEGRIHAVRDGEVLFAGATIVRFEGPKWQIKWVESLFTNHIRRCSSVATKIARVVSVCDDKDIILEGSLRRSNDTDGIWTAHSAYIAGAHSTSNVLAGEIFGIPWGGSMDHFTVQVMIEEYFNQNPDLEITFETVSEAQRWTFREVIASNPKNSVLLVDTLGVKVGLDDAIVVLKELKPKNYAIRIDSGDLNKWSKIARKLLDKAGLHDVEISPSGGLSALTVKSLKDQGCPGNRWQLGEYLQFRGELARHGATISEPAVNIEFVSKYGGANDGSFESIKLSGTAAKNSRPGPQADLRMLDDQGNFDGNVTVNLNQFTIPQDGVLTANVVSIRPQDLDATKTFKAGTKFEVTMQLVFENEEIVKSVIPLYETESTRNFHEIQMSRLGGKYKRVDGCHAIYGVGVEEKLYMRGKQMGESKVIVYRNKAA